MLLSCSPFQKKTCTGYNNGERDLRPCSEKISHHPSHIFYRVIIAAIQGADSKCIIFSDVTVYMCDVNDSCGLYLEQPSNSKKPAAVVQYSSDLTCRPS